MSIRQRPSRYFSRLAIDDLNILRIRDVDEDARALGFELKPLRMSLELILRCQTFVGYRIDDGDGSVAVAQIDLLRDRIVAQVIGIRTLAEVDCAEKREFVAVIDI